MYINGFDGDPYAEVQYILEVLERGNPVKGISRESAIIQIEQSDKKNIQIVLKELEDRGYEIISKREYPTFVAAGIKLKKKEKEMPKMSVEKQEGLEYGE